MLSYVDTSGSGGFRLSPVVDSGDPSVRAANLTLVTDTQTSLTFGFRAYNAYLVRNGSI